MLENRTIAAIATPPGQGGIAVVRLSGPRELPHRGAGIPPHGQP